jgi:hypothetical protein
MSLLRLLSTGKSLIGLKTTANPYRMRTENRLPRFNSEKNPFAPTPKAESAKPGSKAVSGKMETDPLFETEPKAAPAPAPAREAPVVAEAKPIEIPEAKKIEAKPVSPAPAAIVAKPKIREALTGLVKKLNPAAYLPKRQPGPRAGRPKGARPVVQGELSLEKVRVLRNDLNDCDLELVSTKPATSTGTAGTILPTMPGSRVTTWGRLTSRIAGAMQTQTQ